MLKLKLLNTLIIILPFLVPSTSFAKEKAKKRYQIKNKQITFRVSPRTPEQMSAFYEGRGFSKKMLIELEQHCFFTIGIHNKTDDILWHDLSVWKYQNANGEFLSFTRAHWKKRWQEMNIPMAHQSTFRWTLLPEALDFRPNEHEGGNIILPNLNQPFSLQARFKTKQNKQGKPITIKIDNIQCRR